MKRATVAVVFAALAGIGVSAQSPGDAREDVAAAPKRFYEAYHYSRDVHRSTRLLSGNKPIVGREAVRAFHAAAAPRLKGHVKVAGRVVVTGLEGAMPMLAELGEPSNGVIDVIDVMTFDTNGKIIVMRAYVSPR